MAEAAEDPRETIHHPRRRMTLVGHEAAEQKLLHAYASGRMHHAWLICGPRGIGKATLAYRLARYVLHNPDPEMAGDRVSLDVPPQSGVARRIAARGHADLLVIERAFDPKRERIKSEIVVDGAREAGGFFAKTAGEGGWRVCIVDPADDLNAESANALLKVLEEPPPKSLFLIISHRPGSLLATIRSRCLRLDLQPLSEQQTLGVLAETSPDEDGEARKRAAILSGGSPGRALDLMATTGAETFEAFRTAIEGRGGLGLPQQFNLAERFAGRDTGDDFDIFCDLLLDWTAGQARRAAQAGRGAELAKIHGEIAHSIRLTNALNLDRRQAILGALSRLDEAMKAA